jgi:hypothetical protein
MMQKKSSLGKLSADKLLNAYKVIFYVEFDWLEIVRVFFILKIWGGNPNTNPKIHKVITYIEYRAVSGVFRTIDSPPPLHPASVSSPAPKAYTFAGR